MITDYRKEEGGSLLRRPSDDGAVTQSLNLPPLITRSVDQFIQNNLGDTEFAAVPPRKGSVDTKSCPADLSAARRRSSVVFAPFSVNPRVQPDEPILPEKTVKVDVRMNIKSIQTGSRLPPLSRKRQRMRRRKRLENTGQFGQTGASSYVSLWIDDPNDLLKRAKHFGSNIHRVSSRRNKRKISFTFPSGFRKPASASYFVK